ncbi:flagellar basal body-associated FliL family protein [Allochromatium humboldtianum]|uniref:Flagellar protein FliL n=1 Tax=Allochromatium humboldtianum TaxID=504901 RepID=A0A850R5Q8_9GAMM|nr:flagellar basal body-associated FliL family protein [Allochromatium humboldtianum]NVZ10009.1 flagellar basal body-associated FliL family protein [Allochromatium humboldtianum]
MAEKKKANKKQADKGAEKAPGGRMKLIILLVILLLLLAGGGGAAYYFLWYGKSADEPEASAEASSEAAPAPAGQTEEGAAAIPVAGPLIYHKIESLTVNLSPGGPVRFLRVSLTITTPNQAVTTAVDKHMPMLRNDILTVLAAQEYAALNTPEGKDTLRESLRQTLVRLLARTSEPSDIRDVLFNELIMQ